MSLFDTGVRPALDAYLTEKTKEVRDYGSYWSASSAGYCMRLNILKRLKVPVVPEIQEDAMRTQRVFEVGHIFHEWAQRITKDAGLSIAQELELQDEGLMVRGHIDDLVVIQPITGTVPDCPQEDIEFQEPMNVYGKERLILYDYKTAKSQAFNYKTDEIGHYHKMQLGTYMYMLRTGKVRTFTLGSTVVSVDSLLEGRILTISKDDLRMKEHQLMWSDGLAGQVVDYWHAINGYWEMKTLPPCTCLEHDGGFMGRRSKKGKVYNPYFYQDEPCSLAWVSQFEEVKEFINKEEK
jgi:hypothetical protein